MSKGGHQVRSPLSPDGELLCSTASFSASDSASHPSSCCFHSAAFSPIVETSLERCFGSSNQLLRPIVTNACNLQRGLAPFCQVRRTHVCLRDSTPGRLAFLV